MLLRIQRNRPIPYIIAPINKAKAKDFEIIDLLLTIKIKVINNPESINPPPKFFLLLKYSRNLFNLLFLEKIRDKENVPIFIKTMQNILISE